MDNHQTIIDNVLVPFYEKIRAGEFVIDKTGVKTVEILVLRMELDPQEMFLNFYDIKKSPVKYFQRELDWYDSQDLCAKDIGQHAKMWLSVCTKDDKQLINSNYGYLVYSKANGSQFDNVLKELVNNSFSRRALMIYNRPSMHYDYCVNGMSDFVCTLGQQFFIRDNELISVVEMRSSDMMYGFFSDFPWFSTVQQRLFVELKQYYPELTMGKLIWVSNSAHLYERHFNVVSEIVEFHKTSKCGEEQA